MTNNHTADVGAIYRNILIDLPDKRKGEEDGRVVLNFKHAFDPLTVVPFSQTESGYIACKFTLGCKR